jgi:SAM-dependent methyltransferase
MESALDTGRLGLSERLRTFVEEMPYERRSILDLMMKAAREIPPGARLADVGAGDSPYRELFVHTDYVAIDWAQSPHEGARQVEIEASADAIPVADGAFDAVLSTQVLEHVPDPAAVVRELHRILRAGGHAYLTVPLVWELHELPHDYFRYTEPGLRHLLESAGFEVLGVAPRNDCFTTLAQLMLNVRHAAGSAPDGLDERREAAAKLLTELAEQVAQLAPLDAQRILPLGYAATARRP